MADHGIVIGINSYPEMGDLRGPCNDAQAFYDWLIDPDGGALEETNVAKFLSTDYDEPTSIDDARPNETDVVTLFAPIIREISLGNHIPGRLFVYVAGHGFADTQEQEGGALYTANAAQYLPFHVAISRCTNWIRRNWGFDEIALIMDCCRVRNPLHDVRDPQFPRTNGSINADRVKKFYGFATGWGSESRETDFDGATRGIFSVAFMDALRNATPNRLGRLTGTIVEDYVHNVIGTIADGISISPPEFVASDRKDVCFLIRGRNTKSVHFVADPAKIGKVLVIFTHDLVEVERLTIEEKKFEVSLDSGRFYSCKIVGEDVSHPFQVPSDASIQI